MSRASTLAVAPAWIGSWYFVLSRLSGRQAMVAALLLGAVSAGALPPVHAVPALLVAVPGLLALLDGAAGWRRAAAIGFCFGFGHHVPGLYWITEAILFEAARFWWLVPLAVPALAAVLAVFIAVPAAIAKLLPAGWPRVFGLAGAWVFADLARQFVLTGFPWNLWGSVWAIPGRLGDVMLQPAALIGVHGLTLATLLLAATPALGRRAILIGGAVLGTWAAFGLWRIDESVAADPGPLAIVVQGDIAQGHKWDRAFALDTFSRYLALTRQGVAAADGRPHFVVWPETASPFLLDTDAPARAAIIDATAGAPALIGSVRFDAAGRPRNSLMAIVSASVPVAIYDKWHLVPFGEYVPEWLPLPIQIVPGAGFARGGGPRTMHVPGLPPVGALICYEAIFPGEVAERSDRPAWLVNVTNDAWFGNSSGPRQHLAAVRMRAVEEGLPLVRAANSGISAVFDGMGHERGRVGLDQSGVLAVALPPSLPPTPFSRLGLALPALLAALCLAGAMRLARRNFRN